MRSARNSCPTHGSLDSSLKTALELSYIAPRIGGVLVSGERGTANHGGPRIRAHGLR